MLNGHAGLQEKIASTIEMSSDLKQNTDCRLKAATSAVPEHSGLCYGICTIAWLAMA